jgi:hypothetical protein
MHEIQQGQEIKIKIVTPILINPPAPTNIKIVTPKRPNGSFSQVAQCYPSSSCTFGQPNFCLKQKPQLSLSSFPNGVKFGAFDICL